MASTSLRTARWSAGGSSSTRRSRLSRRAVLGAHAAGVVGEETNKLVGYLAAVSRKLPAEIYTHVSIERLKAVHAQTHPARLTHARAPAASSLAAEAAKDNDRDEA